ncbi:MAG: hypothetical protein ACR2GY_01725 [Phycisphaerales bacterium]
MPNQPDPKKPVKSDHQSKKPGEKSAAPKIGEQHKDDKKKTAK